ncbi:hypothetical protein V2J56_09330 [Georgenia sp. MJ206]|uniref:hypothetical protein n=1 Tax=Georgenia wangjunii TaxID=3117730 RepID=UPI002F260DDD
MTGSEVLPWYEGHQAITNADDVPRRFTCARVPIPVQARIVWEDDGVELLDTLATAWTARLVLVDVSDRRNRINAAWLALADVRRR